MCQFSLLLHQIKSKVEQWGTYKNVSHFLFCWILHAVLVPPLVKVKLQVNTERWIHLEVNLLCARVLWLNVAKVWPSPRHNLVLAQHHPSVLHSLIFSLHESVQWSENCHLETETETLNVKAFLLWSWSFCVACVTRIWTAQIKTFNISSNRNLCIMWQNGQIV